MTFGKETLVIFKRPRVSALGLFSYNLQDRKMAQSVAWKVLERLVAKKLGGQRILRGYDYSASLPDVVAPSEILGIPGRQILVECKHSKHQPFLEYMRPVLEGNKNTAATITSSNRDTFLFWDFANTGKLLPIKAEQFCIDRKIPRYLLDYYEQSANYTLSSLGLRRLVEITEEPMSMVVIAKKNCPFRLAFTSIKEIEKFSSC